MSEDMRNGLEAVADPNRHDLAALPPLSQMSADMSAQTSQSSELQDTLRVLGPALRTVETSNNVDTGSLHRSCGVASAIPYLAGDSRSAKTQMVTSTHESDPKSVSSIDTYSLRPASLQEMEDAK